MSATLIGVGLGPGDPQLLTLAAVQALRNADVVFTPVSVTTTGPGYAERIIAEHVEPDRLCRLEFELAAERRVESWKAAAVKVVDRLDAGITAVFATIGDPNVYSTFTYLAREVSSIGADISLRTIPGITAMQDLASRSGTVLCEHDEPLTLMPATAGDEAMAAALAGPGTVVVYKGASRLAAVRSLVEQADALDRTVFGTRLGQDGERIEAGIPESREAYLSTVIVAAPNTTGEV